MRKASLGKTGILLVAALLLVQAALLSGCGKNKAAGPEEELVEFTLNEILVPRERDRNFVAAWTRKSESIADISSGDLAKRFWKWEGGVLTEITREEYDQMISASQAGGRGSWAYSQHTITVLQADWDKGEATVEIGTLHGPMTGAGIRYFLRREGGQWKKVSEQTVWMT